MLLQNKTNEYGHLNQLLNLRCGVILHRCWVSLLSLCIVFVSGCSRSTESSFLTAAAAFQNKDKFTLEQLSLEMSGNVLGMYPEYFLLYLDLPYLSPQVVSDFATKYKHSASAEKLVADYVEEKVRRGELSQANAVANLIQNPDKEEACAIAVAKSSKGDIGPLVRLLPSVWYDAQKSKTCIIAAQTITHSVKMDPLFVKHRLWTMLRDDELTAASNDASIQGLYLDLQTLFDAKRNPQTYMYEQDLSGFAAQSYFIVAFTQLARSQGVYAAEQALFTLQSALPEEPRAYAYRLLALSRIEKNVDQGIDPKVVEWLDKSIRLPFSEFEAEKYGVHAVREGKWHSVLNAIDVMSDVQKEQLVWQYWFARASEGMPSKRAKEIATQFYQAIGQSDDQYYGLLAKARTGKAHKRQQYQVSEKDRNQLANNDAFARAFLLREMGADDAFVNREWNWAVRQAVKNDQEGVVLAAAERASHMEWYDRAIYAASKTEKLKNDQLAYPVPFYNDVIGASREFGADAAWVYALMRQESRFKTNARSHVGASGLMQIMPATNRWIAGKLGESASNMTPTKNIRFGTYYIHHVYNQLGAQAVLATAGYNGGPSRAKRWQPDYNTMSADQYVEAIPFSETRDYVKNVMANAIYYDQVLKLPTRTIIDRMGTISPKNNVGIEGP